MKKRYYSSLKSCIILISAILIASCSNNATQEIDLSGQWKFSIDSLDRGVDEVWYSKKLTDDIILPGSMASNNKGNDITVQTKWTGGIKDESYFTDEKYAPYREEGNIKIPFWLQPKKHYQGAAWYQQEISVPASWKDNSIKLILERPHWETMVWIDDVYVGVQNRLATSHEYILPEMEPGKHTLTIRVDNRIKEINPGINSHSISDHTQTNWNGIVGDILLQKVNDVSIEDVRVFPETDNSTATVFVSLKNNGEGSKKVDLSVTATTGDQSTTVASHAQEVSIESDKTVQVDLRIENPVLWDEFNPELYNLTVKVKSQGRVRTKEISFGMRELSTIGKRFTINGRPMFLRGALDCAAFPLTGYPPTDEAPWEKIFTALKDHGLNHLRFHSWCPPEAAFNVADRMGFYLQIEASSWANQGVTIGDGDPLDQWLYDEGEAIIKAYGNHPSFCFMAYGNEPGGKNRSQYLEEYVTHFKELDGRHLYTGGAGWPKINVADYYNAAQARIQGWGDGLTSIINSQPPSTSYDFRDIINDTDMPYVSHEIGQWCVYPNFREIEKYTGVLQAKNFEIFQETLENNHLGHLAGSFLLASGKLQALCYKADIEAALRTPEMAGFQLLDLNDFPGQGTALVGVLDAFWEEKGYITPEEYSRFCNQIVPLVRLDQRIFIEGETLKAGVEVANFSAASMNDVEIKWSIKTIDVVNRVIQKGSFEHLDIPIGNGKQYGEIVATFPSLDKPEKMNLEVTVGEYSNSWDIWVYPENKQVASKLDVLVTEQMDKKAIQELEAGNSVLLSVGRGKVKKGKGGEVGVGFSSIFWNTSWTEGQKPHTLGILCNPKHPALKYFPTEFHSNWQWWDAMSHADAINLHEVSTDLQPIVRIIDDWFENRSLGLLFEVKVGNGKLLISGADLVNDLDKRPEARQLLFSLNQYMNSSAFNPTVKTTAEQISELLIQQ